MTKEALGVGGRDGLEGLANGGQKVRICAGFGLAQVSFDLGPHHFDWVEIGAVGRQKEQLSSASFDELLRLGVAVSRQVVADHDVAGAQGGAEHLADIFPKNVGVGGPFDDQATGHPVEPDGTEHGDGVPVAARGVIVQPLAATHPAPQPRHVGLGRRLVDEDQPPGRPLPLILFPELSLLGDVSAILFAGPQRFFYSGSPAA